jgi:GTP-binding protein YchF
MLHAALVGFPSAGKTTLFHLMTSARDTPRGRADTAVGISRVPDARLDRLTAMYTPRKHVPATIEFTDIVAPGKTGAAALVDVAGYKNADALVHVVRAFRDDAVAPPRGSIDPARDAQTMEEELILADLGVVERRRERLDRDLKKGKSSELEHERALVERCRAALEGGQPLRALGLAGADRRRLRGFQLLSAKPLLIVMNLDEADLAALSSVDRAAEITGLTSFLSRAATRAVPVCAKIELEMADLEPADAHVFLADLGLGESGLARVIRASYDLLGCISFFTVGDDECRAWSIPRGTIAHEAAAEIHSDIARGFIRAEVVTYDALVGRGSMAACREHGEVRLEGKEYVVQDGDIINFRFAT